MRISNILMGSCLTFVLAVSSPSAHSADKNSVGAAGKPAQGETMMAPTAPGKKPKGTGNVVGGVKIGVMEMSAADCTAKKGTIKDGPLALCTSGQYCSIKNAAGDVVAAECIDAKK